MNPNMKSLNTKTIILAASLLTSLLGTTAYAQATSFKATTIVDRKFERTETSEEEAAAQDVADALAILDADKACSKFATQNGLGKYGEEIKRAFQGNNFDSLLKGTADLRKVCPRFDQMRNDEKVELYTVILGGMAFYESTCREYVKAQGPNGTLFGFFQLHKGKEPDYDEGRVCRPGDSNPKNGRMMQCTLSTLNRYVEISNKLFPNRGNGETYWETLQNNAKPKQQVPTVLRSHIRANKANGASLIKIAIRDYCAPNK